MPATATMMQEDSQLLTRLATEDRARLLQPAIERHIVPGQDVHPLDANGALLLVRSGRFRVDMMSRSGRMVGMMMAQPGEWFGGFALLAGVPPYHASVTCQSEGVLAEIPGHHMRACLSQMPALAEAMLLRASEMIVSLVDRIVAMTTLGLRDRLIVELLRLSRSAPTGTPVNLSPAPSHADLGTLLGASREAVTRELGALSRAGLLRTGRQSIHLINRDALIAALSDDHAAAMAEHFDPIIERSVP